MLFFGFEPPPHAIEKKEEKKKKKGGGGGGGSLCSSCSQKVCLLSISDNQTLIKQSINLHALSLGLIRGGQQTTSGRCSRHSQHPSVCYRSTDRGTRYRSTDRGLTSGDHQAHWECTQAYWMADTRTRVNWPRPCFCLPPPSSSSTSVPWQKAHLKQHAALTQYKGFAWVTVALAEHWHGGPFCCCPVLLAGVFWTCQ